LCVETPPPHPGSEVGRVDRAEALLGVDVLDPLAHVQPVVVALGALGRVEGLVVPEGPLPFSSFPGGLALAHRFRSITTSEMKEGRFRGPFPSPCCSRMFSSRPQVAPRALRAGA